MRLLFIAPLLAALLFSPARASAQAAGATSVAAVEVPAKPGERALATVVEILSPFGGAGCFYRHRYLTGVVVIAGSLIGGGLLLDAVHRQDPDVTVIGAVSYGVARALGVAAAVQSYPVLFPAWSFSDPASRAGVLPAPTVRTLGFSYGVSF